MTRFLAPLLLSGLLAGVALGASAPTVKVGHNRLEPAEITVPVGTTVTFHNEDEMPGGHSIVADDGSFKSPGLAKGQDWTHKFDKAGTYSYSIKEHPTAKGKVVVK